MTTYALSGLLSEDVQYIKSKIRADFDALKFPESLYRAQELIDMAKRVGFAELAAEMKNDLTTPVSKSNL